jgi:hypothetical protein
MVSCHLGELSPIKDSAKVSMPSCSQQLPLHYPHHHYSGHVESACVVFAWFTLEIAAWLSTHFTHLLILYSILWNFKKWIRNSFGAAIQNNSALVELSTLGTPSTGPMPHTKTCWSWVKSHVHTYDLLPNDYHLSTHDKVVKIHNFSHLFMATMAMT